MPRKTESLQAVFWATKKFCPKSSRVFGGLLATRRRINVFCSRVTRPSAPAPRETFRRRPPPPHGPQRQSPRDGLCPRAHAPHRSGKGLWPDHRQGPGRPRGLIVGLPQRQERPLLPVL